MAEYFVEFKSKLNGYDKKEVDRFVRDAEAKIKENAVVINDLQNRVVELETRIHNLTGSDTTVEEKVVLYDKLMKKMEGDYSKILEPAVTKAKSIKVKAESEYALRMDQAKYAAEGIYKEVTDRMAEAIDHHMDGVFERLDKYFYSRTLPGRIEAFIDGCKVAGARIASGSRAGYEKLMTAASAKKKAAAKKRGQKAKHY